jgi:acyl-CoA synthetase (AMP-forming)/AMP-acid ligase II
MDHTLLLSFMAEKLAKFKLPAHIFLWGTDQLPRGPTGKIPKKDIRDQIKKGTSGATVLYSVPFTRNKARL